MAIPLKGIIGGRIMELERGPGWPDGQEVTVLIDRPADGSMAVPVGELPGGESRSFECSTRDAEVSGTVRRAGPGLAQIRQAATRPSIFPLDTDLARSLRLRGPLTVVMAPGSQEI
jgi:hypothetical protein